MGENWARKNGVNFYIFKKMGNPKIKKRQAKNGLKKKIEFLKK